MGPLEQCRRHRHSLEAVGLVQRDVGPLQQAQQRILGPVAADELDSVDPAPLVGSQEYGVGPRGFYFRPSLFPSSECPVILDSILEGTNQVSLCLW